MPSDRILSTPKPIVYKSLCCLFPMFFAGFLDCHVASTLYKIVLGVMKSSPGEFFMYLIRPLVGENPLFWHNPSTGLDIIVPSAQNTYTLCVLGAWHDSCSINGKQANKTNINHHDHSYAVCSYRAAWIDKCGGENSFRGGEEKWRKIDSDTPAPIYSSTDLNRASFSIP